MAKSQPKVTSLMRWQPTHAFKIRHLDHGRATVKQQCVGCHYDRSAHVAEWSLSHPVRSSLF
jgi:hypothetical protein